MKLIQLPDPLHEYLIHVVEKHAASGIHPEEGLAVSKLWEAVTRAATIDEAVLQKRLEESATPPPRKWEPGGRTPECQQCFAEFNSDTCLRPAHKEPIPTKDGPEG